MKIKRGLPAGFMSIDKRLQPLVKKIHQLSSNDLNELEAFIDYLLKGPDQLHDQKMKAASQKIYEFMDGGFNQK